MDPGLARILWPELADEMGLPLVYDTASARHIPAVSRAVAVYTSLVKQMPLEDVKARVPQEPVPPILTDPDPLSTLPGFLQVSVEDYLQDGNTISVITGTDATGWPTSSVWVPISWVDIEHTDEAYPGDVRYLICGREVPRDRVVHVRRGRDRRFPWRGVGVIEEHFATLDRIAREEAYEANTLKDGAVPSVAVIAANPGTSQPQLDKAKTSWMKKFAGKREPVMLPGGTQVIPLSWSPADAQLQAARQMSLLDVANCFNLDGYWVGAPSSSMTYQSPTPMFNNLRVISLESVLIDFEAVWSKAWLPRGHTVRFDRLVLTRDDLQTTVTTLAAAISAGLMTTDEARAYMNRAPLPPAAAPPVPEEVPA